MFKFQFDAEFTPNPPLFFRTREVSAIFWGIICLSNDEEVDRYSLLVNDTETLPET